MSLRGLDNVVVLLQERKGRATTEVGGSGASGGANERVGVWTLLLRR